MPLQQHLGTSASWSGFAASLVFLATSLLSSLGALFGAVLEVSWGHLWLFRGTLGPSWGCLGLSWGPLVCLGGLSGPSWRPLRAVLGLFWAVLNLRRPSSAVLGPSCAALGQLRGPLWTLWGIPCALRGPRNHPEPNRLEAQAYKNIGGTHVLFIHFSHPGVLFGPSWGVWDHLGGLVGLFLGPSCAVRSPLGPSEAALGASWTISAASWAIRRFSAATEGLAGWAERLVMRLAEPNQR